MPERRPGSGGGEDAGPARRRLGLIVNPVAGVGGRVGLKGSDGEDVLRRALELGAVREAPHRAQRALARLAHLRDGLQVLTYPGEMGEDEARAAGFDDVVIVGRPADDGTIAVGGTVVPHTTPADTEAAARALADHGVDLLLFAGGDGTARNVFNAVGERVPAVGVPAGVKIHSAVYATTPAAAGDLAALYLGAERSMRLREAEVMDIDEEAFRADRVSARLYGYLLVPYERALLQGAKAGGVAGDEAALAGIASDVINGMEPGTLYVLGPGTTTRKIAELLRLPKTLLGVDVVRDRELVAADVDERRLLELVRSAPARIVVTVIGGQGHIFGRGNQQISAEVIRAVGRENIVVVATETKILSLEGRPLLVDTGDEELDRELAGYARVVTSLGRRLMYAVVAESG